MSSWHSYPSIYNLGHAVVRELTDRRVNVEEKIDGSQFSFGLIKGTLRLKSKGKELWVEGPEKMFNKAVDSVLELKPRLHPEWTYRCEYLQKPHHNALAYARVPKHHLMLFDVNIDEELYLDYDSKVDEALRLNMEVVPLLYSGMVTIDKLRALLETVSVLGDQLIEGVVLKPFDYDFFGPDKKVLMGKFVSEAYKEVHDASWKLSNPQKRDIVLSLIDKYRTPARWNKAIQHLRERGELTNSPKDIGPLLKEVPLDVLKEEGDEIKEALFKVFWKDISRGILRGFPEFYKEFLLKLQFEGDKHVDS